MTTLTAFQPQPFPRLHLLDRILYSDIVVMMDEVQYSGKNGVGGGPSGQRHLFLGPDPGHQNPRPIPLPIAKGSSRLPLYRVPLASEDHGPWRNQLVNRIMNIYRGTDTSYLEDFLLGVLDTDSLLAVSELTTDLALTALRIPQDRLLSGSTLGLPELSGSTRILAYCLEFGADTYLCGEPSLNYLDADAFAAAGVTIKTQKWDPPQYHQHWGYWCPNLSWLDATLHSVPLRTAIEGS